MVSEDGKINTLKIIMETLSSCKVREVYLNDTVYVRTPCQKETKYSLVVNMKGPIIK